MRKNDGVGIACLAAAMVLSGCLFGGGSEPHSGDRDSGLSDSGSTGDAGYVPDAAGDGGGGGGGDSGGGGDDMSVPPGDASTDTGGPQTTLTVTHLENVFDGSCDVVHCSLPDALAEAETRGGGTIDFQIIDTPDTGALITVQNSLIVPANTVIAHTLDVNPITIEMAGGADLFVIEGANSELRGLHLFSANAGAILVDIVGTGAQVTNCELDGGIVGVRVRASAALTGLTITSAAEAGVVVNHDALLPAVIKDSRIGVTRGDTDGGNGEGVRILRGSARLGSGTEPNLIGFNKGPGITVMGGNASVALLGNFIGTSAVEQEMPNDGAGVFVSNADSVAVGSPSCDTPCNILASNRGPGIHVESARALSIANNALRAPSVPNTDCISIGGSVDAAIVGRDDDPGEPSENCDEGCNLISGCTGAGITSSAANLTLAANHFGALTNGSRIGLPILKQNVFITGGNADVHANVFTQSGEESVRVEGAGNTSVAFNRLGTTANGLNCTQPFLTAAQQSAVFINKFGGATSIVGNVIGCVETNVAAGGVAFGIHLPGSNSARNVQVERNFVGIAADGVTVLAMAGNAVWLGAGSGSFVDNVIVSTVRHAINVAAPFAPLSITGDVLRSSGFPALQINGGSGHRFSNVIMESQSPNGVIRASGDGTVGFTFQDMVSMSNSVPKLVNLGVVTAPGPNLGLSAPSIETIPNAAAPSVTGRADVPGAMIDVYGGTALAAGPLVASCDVGADNRWSCPLAPTINRTRLFAFQRALVANLTITAAVMNVTMTAGGVVVASVDRNASESDDAFLSRVISSFGTPSLVTTGDPGCTAACARVAYGINGELSVDGVRAPDLGEIISAEASASL